MDTDHGDVHFLWQLMMLFNVWESHRPLAGAAQQSLDHIFLHGDITNIILM